MLLAQADPEHSTLLLLFAAIAVLYIAGRLAIFALAGADRSAGGRAIGQWMPIAAATVFAVLMHHPEMVASLIFGTSIACLSMALGMAILLAPMTEQTSRQSVWAFVCPAAIVVFMAGFKGELVWWHGLFLLLLGLSILGIWNEKASAASTDPSKAQLNASGSSSNSKATITLIVAVLFAGVGGWLAVRQTPIAAMNSRWMSTGMLASLILSPLLALPTFVTITHVAQRGHPNIAIGALVGTVLLNLCLLLPLAIFIHYVLTAFGARGQLDGNSLAAMSNMGQALPYPAAVWRLDTVVLMMLGFLLIPVSMGRWLIGASTALCLSLGYMFYLVINFVLLIRH